MLDHSEKVLDSESMKRKHSATDLNEENSSSSSSSNGSVINETKSTDTKKTCADCGTTKTPLWRGGPAGPKSLCNACGIRSRKKRRAVIAAAAAAAGGRSEEKKPRKGGSGGTQSRNPNIGDSLKQRLMELGREVMTQRSTVEKQRRKLGEEEQAAMLLMALSCGSVYA